MRKVNVATTSVIKVQRIFREHLTRNHYNKSIEKRRRELAVTHELEQRDIALKQQIDIHAKLVWAAVVDAFSTSYCQENKSPIDISWMSMVVFAYHCDRRGLKGHRIFTVRS